MRAVGGSGTTQIERSRRQTGTYAATGFTRQMLRPVELAAAAAAAMRQMVVLRRGMRR